MFCYRYAQERRALFVDNVFRRVCLEEVQTLDTVVLRPSRSRWHHNATTKIVDVIPDDVREIELILRFRICFIRVVSGG